MFHKISIPASQAVQSREALETVICTLHAREFRWIKIKTSSTSGTVEIGYIVVVTDNERKIGRNEHTSIAVSQTSITLPSIDKIT